ncbi:MAG TPA: YbaB/EbfC family nucleoid-associated protein [Marmoricola sp.]|nr:YbaB/EbfC family nucleoid-associated protein [Marmoricola sp.]HNN48141.1 YbaB/EbfC family nucleoid-associated protein [Marmoricola sp.]
MTEGGFDFGAMLEQAQQVQADLIRAQQELADTTVEGAAGGVVVRVNGVGDLAAVEISDQAIAGTDADSLADLGDLIVAAYRNAKSQADQIAAATLGPLGGGLDLGALDV